MHHFDSATEYNNFVDSLASNQNNNTNSESGYELSSQIIATVDTNGKGPVVNETSPPPVDTISDCLCPVSILMHSNSQCPIPLDEVESPSHLAALLLAEDLKAHT
jgi:hypothetical protein